MPTVELLGGKVQIYQRGNSRFWQARASVGGKQRQFSTKQEGQELAAKAAESWYFKLHGQAEAGVLNDRPTFRKAADQFLKEYGVITEGERSEKWTESHGIRLRVHLLPFFGALPLDKVTPGKVQEYRVHRMTSYAAPNPHSKSQHKPKAKPPARSTLHDEVVTLRMVLKTAIRHGWLEHLPDLTPPYRPQGKITHRPWFSPEEYKQLYEAARAYAKEPFRSHLKWNAEQVYDFVLFMANTGLRPDEAFNLQHRDVTIAEGDGKQELLEIEVRGKRGVGHCKSMPGAVRVYQRLLARAKPVQAESRRERQHRRRTGGDAPVPSAPEYPGPTDLVFPGNHIKLFNNLLARTGLKLDRDGKARTAYSLRHTYICMRLMEGADIYQVAKNCRTSVEMIEKHYAIHLKNTLDATAINVMRKRAWKAKAKAGAGKGARKAGDVSAELDGDGAD
ncbi:tyrosine-type recombinase/integrase [Acidocella sp.]|uniref:tyrosine-type recombinase/integrase n=1 Tax=Acidocella sp. TaxID=50710 RepID=UPI003D04854D